MKSILISLVIVLAILFILTFSGCGVWMNSEYSALLDKTAALSSNTAERALKGLMTENEMAQALNYQAGIWERFREARDGKE